MTAAKEAKQEATRTVRIRTFTKNIGDGQKETVYATMGLHVAEDHRKFLPQRERTNRRGKKVSDFARKIEPGVNCTLPDDVALFYLKNCGEFLEEVYE